MVSSTQKQVIDLINRSQRILVLPSSPPDGDSIGSAVALYLALKKLGKEVTVVCNDPIPEVLQFLPNIRIVGNKVISTNDFVVTVDLNNRDLADVKTQIENNKLNIVITPKEGKFSEDDISYNKGEADYDLIITVDCAELTQLKGFYENNVELFHQIPVVNIDHHISNAHFGKVNYVDIMASSTTELILPIFEEIALQNKEDIIDEDVATLLLTGIITDTGSFQNANTTPKAFDEAAKLVAYGARQQEIIQNIYKTKQLSQLKLWGRVLSKIQTDEKYKLVWSVVSQQDFKDTDSSENETGDIIDELMTNAPGAEVIMLMKEREDGSVSISLRTTNSAVDAAEIAEKFGGGGHTQAAGFRVGDKDLRQAEYDVIETIKRYQSERLGYEYNRKEEKNHEQPKTVPEIKPKNPEIKPKSAVKKAANKPLKFRKPEELMDREQQKETEKNPPVIYKFED